MARDRPVRPSSSKHAANAGRKTFTRSERALCRFLAHEHSIPAGEIHVATGWSEQSIYNVLRGKHPYTNTDADDDKKHLPQDADTILLKIRNRQIRERMSDLQKDTRQWQLMPSERALCHFLAHEHSVPVAEVHVETGWSVPTIQNVLKGTGSYTKFNPDDDKKHLPSDADAILDKIRTRMADTLHLHAKTMPPPTRALCRFLAAEHVVVGEIRYATGWPVSAIQNVLRGTGNYTYIIANDDKKHLPPDAGAILLKLRTRKAERLNAKFDPNSESPPVDRTPSVEATQTDDMHSTPDYFLLHFLTGLFMDQQWYRVFKNAGIDENAMKEFGRQKSALRAFLDERCATMSDFDRFILEGAAQNLVSFFDH